MRTRTKEFTNVALRYLGVAGFAGTVLVAPNSAKALQMFLEPALKMLDEPEKHRIYRILKRQGYVQVDRDELGYRLTITPAGAHRLQSELLKNITIPTMSKWDKTWRLVCYDIPSEKKAQRYELLGHLHRLGFVMIQKSMWIHPHSCFEAIAQITDALLLKQYVTVLEVNKFDTYTTKKLIHHFQYTIRL